MDDTDDTDLTNPPKAPLNAIGANRCGDAENVACILIGSESREQRVPQAASLIGSPLRL
jgi:hypothetical protein